MKTATSLRLMAAILMCCVLSISSMATAESLSLGLGMSFLRPTIQGESQPNIVTQDVSLALTAPEGFAAYDVKFHHDEVLWQQLKLGAQWRGIRPHYMLVNHQNSVLNGCGVTLHPKYGRNLSVDLSASWLQSGYAFEGKIGTAVKDVSGSIGYGLWKFGDAVFMGPSVEVEVRW